VEKKQPEYQSIDEYIRLFPEHIQKKLTQIREIIKELAPEAQEKISYQMPTFYLRGNLVHFAAFTNHIGFFPTASGVEAFENDLSKFKHAKGSIQFPIGEPLPVELIQKIVRFRVDENMKKNKK
jgi:uncharacterized protein YdhG (YjbR/CyaY superfamily)